MLYDDWDRSREECPQCHRPAAECSDPDRVWYPQRLVCYATRETERLEREWRELHDEKTGRVFHDGTERSWSKTFGAAHPYNYDDGVRLFVTAVDLSPDDDWLSRLQPTAATDADDDEDEGQVS